MTASLYTDLEQMVHEMLEDDELGIPVTWRQISTTTGVEKWLPGDNAFDDYPITLFFSDGFKDWFETTEVTATDTAAVSARITTFVPRVSDLVIRNGKHHVVKAIRTFQPTDLIIFHKFLLAS